MLPWNVLGQQWLEGSNDTGCLSELAPGTMLTAYVAGMFCNVAILPGCAVTLTVAANPTERSIVEINATIAIGIICFLCVSSLCINLFIGISFI